MDEASPRETVEKLYSKCRSLSTRFETYVRRKVAETDALKADIQSLIRAVSTVTKDVEKIKDASEKEELMQRIKAIQGVLNGNGAGGDLRKLCTTKNPLLLRMMLGSNVSVLTYRKEQALGVKEEYHSFRNRFSAGVVLLPTMLMLSMKWADSRMVNGETNRLAPAVMAGHQLFLVWLCYMYLALALRENVLVVNGSNIKSWWIIHHYLSILICLVLLALPVDSPAVYIFSSKFLSWTQFQGIVMLVQNRYQRRRMYTRIALGKDSIMDVVTGESSGARGQLLLLYPMLFVLQFWQVRIGLEVLQTTLGAVLHPGGWVDFDPTGLDLRGQRGVFGAGVVFVLMGILNFLQTIATVRAKLPLSQTGQHK